jgi:hypothetical protein
MPTWFEHPKVFQQVEDYFNVVNAAERRRRRQEAIDRLSAGAGLDLTSLLTPVGLTEVGHFKEHWLDERPAERWWQHPTAAEIEQAIRQGFIDALRDAQEHDLPIELFWVCSGRERPDSEIHVGHQVGDRQVTVIISTPETPDYGG